MPSFTGKTGVRRSAPAPFDKLRVLGICAVPSAAAALGCRTGRAPSGFDATAPELVSICSLLPMSCHPETEGKASAAHHQNWPLGTQDALCSGAPQKLDNCVESEPSAGREVSADGQSVINRPSDGLLACPYCARSLLWVAN